MPLKINRKPLMVFSFLNLQTNLVFKKSKTSHINGYRQCQQNI